MGVDEEQSRESGRSSDWRTYVRLVGRVLVATGLLLLGFVAYQLWGTGIQEARAQNRLENEFEQTLAAATTTSAPPTTTTVPSPTSSAPVSTTLPPPPQVPIPGAPGDPVAMLDIPAIGVSKIVVAGVGTDDLRKGPGHYPDTPLPGQEGNVAIAGHRTTYGAPFFDIDQLQPGDEITLTTTTGQFVYRMSSQQIVPPTEYGVIAPTDDDVITLTSCNPKYSARERIIVRGTFDQAASTGRLAEPTPNYFTAPPSDSAMTVTTPPTSAPGDAQPTTTTPARPTTTAASAGALPPTASFGDSGSADALERGWFDDSDAWPQVALWGTVLIAVALGAWALSRRAGRDWVGALVGVVPFLVVLYFFFENVNRLLPPNL